MQEKPELNLKDVGARFRSVRSLVNVNRKTFCERHNINKYTLQSWENGLHVSKGKNVEKFIEALAKEGIHCYEDWLLYGIGEGPKTTSNLAIKEESLEKLNSILNESDLKILSNIKDLYEKIMKKCLYLNC